MFIYMSLFVAILGLIVYFAATTNTKIAEAGRLAYFAGLLAFCINSAKIVIG